MYKHKHLTLENRSYIQHGLDTGHSIRQIALHLGKHPTTISKEIRLHRKPLVKPPVGRIRNRCIHRFTCSLSGVCDYKDCRWEYCRYCSQCYKHCEDYVEEICPRLSNPPYVCNGCEKMHKRQCSLGKFYYQALAAHKRYKETLSLCREGISFTEADLQWLDEVITPLIKKKQSIHHICATQADNILCSERTIYKYIDQSILTARNIDLPRKVRYRPRKRSKPFTVDRNCRRGRTYEDYLNFMEEHPDTPVVEMDTVEGCRGGKVLLTIFFTQSDFMLMYLRERNTSQSVIDIFNHLEEVLGIETFKQLFPVILTDNGSEFSNPVAIEHNSSAIKRTCLFYCDSSSPHQKPHIERNHEFIRMVFPKGSSFDGLNQRDIDMLACHINSLVRKKLNDQSPTTTFSFFHGEQTLHKLGISLIPPSEVHLSSAMFKG
jgi:IS30 family transposase